MPEFTCSQCGKRFQGDATSVLCPACSAAAIARPEHAEQVKATPPRDGAFSEGEAPLSRGMAETLPAERDDIRVGPPTAAGCLLLLVSVALIFGLAIPIVTWRDPQSGQPLPRMVAIVLPLLAGALCYAIGTGILKLFGLSTFAKSEKRSDKES